MSPLINSCSEASPPTTPPAAAQPEPSTSRKVSPLPDALRDARLLFFAGSILSVCANLQRGHPETSDSSEGAEVNGEEEKKKKKKKKERKHKKHKSTETGSEVCIM